MKLFVHDIMRSDKRLDLDYACSMFHGRTYFKCGLFPFIALHNLIETPSNEAVFQPAGGSQPGLA